jgi:KipI family sensor histidine kinase inhibitor
MKRPGLAPLGDSALLVHFGDEIDPAVNQRVHALDALLRASEIAGIIENVPAYATLAVHYDPLVLTYARAVEWVAAAMERAEGSVSRKPRRIEVPVRYGGEDLEFVAAHHQLSPGEVARIHADREYTVYMMGFTPGFAYMGRLADAIQTPRLETPRTRVAAGSVGIAGAQTGIYPIDSPGGWRIIGRTSVRPFDLESDPPFLFSPGDTVRFIVEAIDA